MLGCLGPEIGGWVWRSGRLLGGCGRRGVLSLCGVGLGRCRLESRFVCSSYSLDEVQFLELPFGFEVVFELEYVDFQGVLVLTHLTENHRPFREEYFV